MDKIVPFPGEFDVVDSITVPRVLASFYSPAGFTVAHAEDKADSDPSINDDLIDTRSAEDELAVFEVNPIQTVAANVDWVNKYYGAFNISNRTQPIKYIVVHYTGSGTTAGGAARNNCQYFAGGNRNASADFFIDDSGIWEYTDSDRYYTWHCGDGGGRYGITNSNSIGIEVCQNGNNPYSGNEILYLTRLVGFLMNKYNIPADRVVRHYDASRKQCPLYYVDQARWNQLHATITQEDDMTPEQSAKLDMIYSHMKWDDKTHFSDLGNLVAQMPIDYDGQVAPLGDRLAYIDKHTHEVDAKLDDIKSMLRDLISRS